jgi:hypothetical protein
LRHVAFPFPEKEDVELDPERGIDNILMLYLNGWMQRRNEGLPTMHCVSLLFTITIFNERLAKSC